MPPEELSEAHEEQTECVIRRFTRIKLFDAFHTRMKDALGSLEDDEAQADNEQNGPSMSCLRKNF